ncbi:PQQ-binding-like beta-propeller repeat protein [Micromonospora sp. NPDC048830]|uniref:outer membrane protein assembly factor BamB family protein n=1 Tax=Micromonospora sp. NPDC048830 TaxID=3364257 RepID=UPI0037241267
MTLIDLGELRGDAEPEPPARPPRAVGRPLRVALAGALALLTLAASAAVVRPPSTVLPGRVGAVEVAVTPDRVYVAEREGPESGGREVAAYATPTRAGEPLRLLWRVSLPGAGGLFGLAERDGVVFVNVDLDTDHPQTILVDAKTGGRLSRHPGSGAPTVGGGLLLLGNSTLGAPGLQLVDLASGRVRWSLPQSLVTFNYHRRGELVDRVVVTSDLLPGADRDGRIEVRDVVSGAVLAARDLKGRERPTYRQVNLAGELLLVTEGEPGGGAVVTAYGLAALDRRWERRLAEFGQAEQCGALLCVSAPRRGEVSALDPATGRTRWSNPRWPWFLVARGDRLLVGAVDQRPTGGGFAVLDAATGRQLGELGRWQLTFARDPDAPLFGVRRTREGDLLVAELDLARAEARVLDVLPDATGECVVAGRSAVCRRVGGAFGWWRLRR